MKSNHKRLIVGVSASKFSDLLVSAKTTLPALLLSIGAPGWMVGWLVPIRESGALLPQAVLGLMLRQIASRYLVWRVGMVIQITAILGIAITAFTLDGSTAGWLFLSCLLILSLGRSSCSLVMKDIQGDIIKQGNRGKIMGMAATVSGLITLGVAVPLTLFGDTISNHVALVLLLVAAASLSACVIALYPVRTCVEPDANHRSAAFFPTDSVVYRFILVRGLFVHSALLAPYFMIYSSQEPASLLPVFLAAEALAALLSSFFWGSIADKNARLTLQLAGGLAMTACMVLLWISEHTVYTVGGCFFLLSIAHSGVRTGRKTYSLDVREGQDRTELVGFSNTAIGVILLVFGSVYALIAANTSFNIIAIMATMLAVAMLLSLYLPAEKSSDS